MMPLEMACCRANRWRLAIGHPDALEDTTQQLLWQGSKIPRNAAVIFIWHCRNPLLSTKGHNKQCLTHRSLGDLDPILKMSF